MKQWKITMVGIGLMAMAGTANADGTSVRCGNYVVSKGATRFEVIQKCGEPVMEEYVGTRWEDNNNKAKGEKRMYFTPGGGRMPFSILMVGGRLESVRTER